MTSEERERMFALCEQIQKETNHKKFTELVLELNVLLERNGDRLRVGRDKPSTD